jgi:hypothetical protein
MNTATNTIGMAADAFGDSKSQHSQSMASHGTTSGHFQDKESYMNNKLNGK